MKTVTLSIAPESADQVKDGWLVARQRDFTGGETLAKLPEMVGRNQLVRMENAIISPEGLITEAWQTDKPLFVNVTGGAVIAPVPGSSLFTIYYGRDLLFINFNFDPSSDTPYDLSDPSEYEGYVARPLGATITGLSAGVPFLGKVFCAYTSLYTDGVLDVTSNVPINPAGGAIDGKRLSKLRQYDNRLWAVCADGPLAFSDNGDAMTWDALNIILAPNREPIIDFKPVQGGAIIITRTSVYAFYGSGTYQDTSILLIQDNLRLSDSAVQVDNVVYVLGNRGVHQVTLNGIKEIPHDQAAFFAENYDTWNALSPAVRGIYLYKFHAILYLFETGYGSKGFIYYIRTGAFCKVEASLPTELPYMLEIPSAETDFILGAGDGSVICRSVYPAGVLSAFRVSTLQFRHEDADSTREKIWRHLGINVEAATYNVLLQVYLDHSETPKILLNSAIDLLPGDNIFELFDNEGNFLRSRTISIELTIGGNDYLTSDPTVTVPEVEVLTTGGGEPLMSDELTDKSPAFAIREVRLKYCEVGPWR